MAIVVVVFLMSLFVTSLESLEDRFEENEDYYDIDYEFSEDYDYNNDIISDGSRDERDR